MRIRSTLAGLVLGAGALLLAAPVASADTQPTAPPAPSTTVRPEPTTSAPAATRQRPAEPPVARPAEGRPQVVQKPRGAAETGAGMEDAGSSNTGMMLVGGVVLVAVAGGGTVAVRRLRKQS